MFKSQVTRSATFTALLAFAGITGCDQDPSFKETPVTDESLPLDSDANQGDANNSSQKGDDHQGSTAPGKSQPNDGTNPNPFLTIKKLFQTHDVAEANAHLSEDALFIEEKIVMNSEIIKETSELKQIVRPAKEDQFAQGTRGQDITEQFFPTIEKPLDILLVIDNSGSMAEEQNNLATKLEPLLEYIEGADWQIGIVTTDTNDNCLRALVERDDPNRSNAFRKGVRAGTKGDGNETAVLQAVRSLQGSCLAKPWIRPDSTLAIMIVSDEDNCSDGKGCFGEDHAEGRFLTSYLSTIRNVGHNARVYGLFWHPQDSSWRCSTAENRAYIYSDLVQTTNGSWGSICSNDYTPILRSMSKHISEVLAKSYPLQHVPSPNTLKVTIDGQEITSGFKMMGQVLEFAETPEGSELTISYQHDARPMNSMFQLSEQPAADSVKVYMNGALVHPTEYQVHLKTLEFRDLPRENAQIRVNYRTGSKLPQVFQFNKPIQGIRTNVQADGWSGTSEILDAANGTIKLTPAPIDGANVRLVQDQLGKPIYRYPLAYTTQEGGLQIKDAQTNIPIEAIIRDKFITIPPEEFAHAREILVRSRHADKDLHLELEHPPQNSMVTITSDEFSCPASDWKLQGHVLDLSRCNFPASAKEVHIKYSYIAKQHQEFRLDSGLDLSQYETRFDVKVGGESFYEFKTEGDVITLNAPMEKPSSLDVTMHYRAL